MPNEITSGVVLLNAQQCFPVFYDANSNGEIDQGDIAYDCGIYRELTDVLNSTSDNAGRFAVRVDYDLDETGPEGCHGTDWFFPDEPIEFGFTLLDGGYVFVSTSHVFPRDGSSNDWVTLMTPDKNLIPLIAVSGVVEVASWSRYSYAISDSTGKFKRYKATLDEHEFPKCYQESGHLNPDFTPEQSDIASQFFQALGALRPAEAEGE